ncbi:MAG: DUF4325 domain-containing protein [Patescibacteria group bacterium]|nr:STAS-like domain-containing protein [Patescibacteria group bacterium]
MKISLKKFGTVLISRQLGQESFKAFKPTLDKITENEIVEIDFEGITTFSPSWGDEFLSPILEKYGQKLILLNTQNPSVKTTLQLLKDLDNKQFNIAS